jgi:hypothetical protein
MDSPSSPRKSLLSRASAKAASASASVLGGISKYTITQKIDDAKTILKYRKERLLNQAYETNAKNLRLSRSGNKFTGSMFGRPIDKKRQQEIFELYKTAEGILDEKWAKFLALTKSPTNLADYAEEQATHKHYIGEGGKKKGKSRKSSKSSKTRKNRKTRSRK